MLFRLVFSVLSILLIYDVMNRYIEYKKKKDKNRR